MKLALIGRDAHRVLAFRGSLIRAAQEAGHEVIAITAPAANDAPGSLLQAGVRWFSAPLDAGGVNPLADLRYARALRDVLRAERVDAVFAYNPKCIAHAPAAARAAGVARVVAMVTGLGHGFTGTGLRERVVRWQKARLYRQAFRHCDAVLVQNEADLQELERCGAIDSDTHARVQMVAGSGVDLTEFPCVPVRDGAHFLMVARPLAEKGLPEFLEASRRAAARLPGATFTWLGPKRDPNPSTLAADTLQRLLAGSVVRHVDEQTDVRPWLAECTVFVLPSHREGTSKVMLEAMATGRAVITTDAPGCGAVVGASDFGAVVRVGDVAALAEAMVRLGSRPETLAELGRRARAMAKSRFDARLVDRAVLQALGLIAARDAI
jgi:glycosyltransferase involved in cell wall biosynthesis